jgi:hypothetical protein
MVSLRPKQFKGIKKLNYLKTLKEKVKEKVSSKPVKKTGNKNINVKGNVAKTLKGKENALQAKNQGKTAVVIDPKKIKYLPSKSLASVATSPLNKYKANIGFAKFKRPIFFVFASSVFAGMKDNPNFETPSPAISDIQNEIGLYNTAKKNKNTGQASQCFVNIIYMMKQLGVYVANECGNDPVVFASSKFVANRAKGGKSIVLVKGRIKKVKDTKISGQAKAFAYHIPGAQWYKGYWIDTEDETKTRHYTKGCKGIKHLFKDLPVGKKLLLFICGSGPLGDGDWSDGKPWMPR